MSFEDDLRAKITQAPFQSEERQLLKVVLGEFGRSNNSSDDSGYKLVRSMIESNEAALQRIHIDNPCREEYINENQILKTLLK